MRLLIRTSRWAIWARRLATFAVPILALSVWLHRKGVIPSETFLLFLTAVSLLACAALIVALIATARIWQTGDRGWNHVLIAMFLSLIALSPALIALPSFLRYPALSDATTDIKSPPELPSAPAKNGDPAWQNADYADDLTDGFPTLATRIYDLPIEVCWAEIEALADQQSWRITQKQAPLDQFSTGQLSAVVRSWFGFYDDLTIILALESDGVHVDMRSASRFGEHDLGVNGRRIEKFLTALDNLIDRARQRGVATSLIAPED